MNPDDVARHGALAVWDIDGNGMDAPDWAAQYGAVLATRIVFLPYGNRTLRARLAIIAPNRRYQISCSNRVSSLLGLDSCCGAFSVWALQESARERAAVEPWCRPLRNWRFPHSICATRQALFLPILFPLNIDSHYQLRNLPNFSAMSNVIFTFITNYS
ncbi:MAG: hypothetical protein WDO70_07105 [Alphaproteobacteria bacterium]